MKLLPASLLAASLLLTPALFAAEASVQQILSDAQTAYMRGDMPTAKKNFEIVLQADPKNQTARNFLRMIQVNEASAPKGNETQKQLATVILPKLELREATFGSALDYVKQQVAKTTGGKTTLNFVLQLSPEQVNTTVTLSLSNIPVTEALRYMGDLAQVQYEYDKYAIKVKPKAGAIASAPTVPTAPAPEK